MSVPGFLLVLDKGSVEWEKQNSVISSMESSFMDLRTVELLFSRWADTVEMDAFMKVVEKEPVDCTHSLELLA